jgi:predicted nucleic-acid-binding protein
MIALDTNILARLYVNDPTDTEAKAQIDLVRKLFTRASALYVPTTVVLELEWVLRAHYKFEPPEVHAVLAHLAGLPNVVIEAWAEVHEASNLSLQGFDFADALHWRLSASAQAMVSFDKAGFARRAGKAKLLPPVHVLDKKFLDSLDVNA